MRMCDVLDHWLSRLHGGPMHTNVNSCAMISATSGSSVAMAATLGTVAMPGVSDAVTIGGCFWAHWRAAEPWVFSFRRLST